MASSSSPQVSEGAKITIPSNVTGLEFHAPVSARKTPYVGIKLPPLHELITRRKKIYRASDTSKGLKGAKLTNLVDLPDLNNYTAVVIDPGTSSMGVEHVRRVNGKTESLFRWETEGFRTDTSVIIQVQRYAHELLSKKPDMLIIELQLSAFGIEYTQHVFINIALIYEVPVVVLSSSSRYTSFGIPMKGNKKKKEMMNMIGRHIFEEENHQESLETLEKVTTKVSPNGSKVSKRKQQSDMLDTITLLMCAEALLIQACEEIQVSSATEECEELTIL